jgi:hypothetical protein
VLGALATITLQLAVGNIWPDATDQDLRVAIHGPDTVPIGDRAVFTANAPPDATLTWITPAGDRIADADPVLDLTTISPGTGTITLIATSPDGATTQTDVTFTVTS